MPAGESATKRTCGDHGAAFDYTPVGTVAGDCMGPFPRSKHGNAHLLMFTDMFTRWIESIPIRKANARNIVRAPNKNIVLCFGCPEIFLSDNGSEFKNETVEKFCRDMGIAFKPIPPYHPRANPVDKTFKTLIVAFLEGKHSKWDDHVDELQFAYNTATQESIRAPSF